MCVMRRKVLGGVMVGKLSDSYVGVEGCKNLGGGREGKGFMEGWGEIIM